MKIKCQTPNGPIVVELKDDDSLKHLKSKLFSKNLPNFKLKFGVPPKEIKNDDETLLSEIGIKNFDVVIVELTNSKKPVVRVQKDDNSCLFRSIAHIFLNDSSQVQTLRSLVVSQIKSNPAKYSSAILGRPVEEYCKWIMLMTSWGGAIELDIFSSYFETSKLG